MECSDSLPAGRCSVLRANLRARRWLCGDSPTGREILRLSFLAAYAVHSYMSYVLCQVVLCWVIGGNCLVCPCSAAVVTAGDSSTLCFPVGSHRFKSAADWGWANRPHYQRLDYCTGVTARVPPFLFSPQPAPVAGGCGPDCGLRSQSNVLYWTSCCYTGPNHISYITFHKYHFKFHKSHFTFHK